MGAKSTMGWWRSPVVEKVTGGLAGSVALLGMGVVSLVCSWSRGRVASRVKGGARKVAGVGE